MEFRKANRGYIIRLFKGEKIIDSITKFCEDKKINSGIFHGIGAVLSIELAFYDLKKKIYTFKKINKLMEIVSLTGNIALLKDKHILHTHIVLSDDKMKAFGGHLKEAIVGGACEIVLTDLQVKIKREYDQDTGLNLWKL